MSNRPITGARRKAVDLSNETAVSIRRFEGNPRMPWAIEPARPGVDLLAWAAENHATVDSRLLDAGAVLLHGFDVRRADDFEAVASALTSELYGGYGDLPRAGESRNIYESTPYPPDQAILFHNESSHLSSWPMRISFCCLVAAETGARPRLPIAA